MNRYYDALSIRQSGILVSVRDSIDERGYPPTIRELQDAHDISSSSVVSYNLTRLHQLGLLSRDPGAARGLRITEAGRIALRSGPDTDASAIDTARRAALGRDVIRQRIHAADSEAERDTWIDAFEVHLLLADDAARAGA